jgi:hypothetical protein
VLRLFEIFKNKEIDDNSKLRPDPAKFLDSAHQVCPKSVDKTNSAVLPFSSVIMPVCQKIVRIILGDEAENEISNSPHGQIVI